MQDLLNEYNELAQTAPFIYYILIGIVIIVSILVCSIIQYKNKHPHDTKYDANHPYKHYPIIVSVERVNNTLVVKSRSISFPKTKPLINKKVDKMNVIEHECQDSAIYDRHDELLDK